MISSPIEKHALASAEKWQRYLADIQRFTADVLPLETQGLLDQAALDRYTFTRRAYLQRREYLTYDGSPPRRDDDE